MASRWGLAPPFSKYWMFWRSGSTAEVAEEVAVVLWSIKEIWGRGGASVEVVLFALIRIAK